MDINARKGSPFMPADKVPWIMLPHLEQLSHKISSIFRLHMARAFKDVFPLAGIVGGLSIIPALFLRRRDVRGLAPP